MHGYTAHKGDVLKRLRRTEGQVRGLQRMVERDQACDKVGEASRESPAWSAPEGVR
ncbi:metal-sensitive transcriptional regulator [Streptomyces sp. NBC_01351]|uniref:metal-sensitive transcriptional regulator n=1 Tax=Streptomyces sp. NBC_01351 TaxID=2903833 RepID=UPI003FCDDE6C